MSSHARFDRLSALGVATLFLASQQLARADFTFTTLNDPLGVNGTYAYGISGSVIVGGYYDSGFHIHGFSYDGATYTTIDDPLATRSNTARGIGGTTVVGVFT